MWQKVVVKVASFVANKARTDPRWRDWIGALLIFILVPFLLLIGALLLTKDKVATYNSTVTSYLFGGGGVPLGLPTNIFDFYQRMRGFMDNLTDAWNVIIEEGLADSEDSDDESDEDEDEDDEADEDDGGCEDDDSSADDEEQGFLWRTDLDERKLLMLISFYVFFCNSDREFTDDDYTSFASSFAVGDTVPDIFTGLNESMGLNLSEEQKENIINSWNDSYGEVFTWGDEGTAVDWGEWKEGRLIKTYHFEDGEIGEAVVQYAMTRLGDPYDPHRRGQGNYVDCSYLTWWAYQQVGIDIPTVEGPQAQWIYENGGEVTEDMLVPGDLVFWSYKPWYSFRSITHTGIYAGDGYVIHASSGKKEVVYVKLFDKDKIKMYGRPY